MKAFHCYENEVAIVYLEEALLALSDRKRNRISRGVEGTSSTPILISMLIDHLSFVL